MYLIQPSVLGTSRRLQKKRPFWMIKKRCGDSLQQFQWSGALDAAAKALGLNSGALLGALLKGVTGEWSLVHVWPSLIESFQEKANT